MKNILLIGVGGFLGALARYGFSIICNNTIIPWGTVAANVIGCLLMGFIAHLLQLKPTLPVANEVNMFVLIGFLGSLTTFSTLIYQTFLSATQGSLQSAMFSFGLQLVLGILLLWLGYITAGYFFR